MSPVQYTELINAFSRQDMIVVCWHPNCLLHRLKSWSDGEWAVYPRQAEYHNYSHGICEHHFKEYVEEAYSVARDESLESKEEIAALAK